MAAVSVYSLQGLAGLGGRLLLGVLADRHGAKPVLIGGLLLQTLAIAPSSRPAALASSTPSPRYSASPMAG